MTRRPVIGSAPWRGPPFVRCCRKIAAGHGLDSGQHIGSAARLQHSQLAHDAAIYRACGLERQRLLERDATIRPVRLDGELKSTVARRSEAVLRRRDETTLPLTDVATETAS